MAQAMTEGVYATGTEKAIVRSSSTKSLPYTPSGTFGATSPYTGEATLYRFLRIEFGASGHAAAPTKPRRGTMQMGAAFPQKCQVFPLSCE